MEIKMKLIKMLAHFHTRGLSGEIEKLWEYGAYLEAISVITYEGTWEVKEKWYERIFEKLPELKGKEEVLDYFLDYHRSGREDLHMLIYAVWAMEGVEKRCLQEFYVKWLDRYRTHENAKWDYRGSQMVLKGAAVWGQADRKDRL
ncbi:MAG TPA: hypothetical protein DF613_02215 [Lachnospiraceae bacterium]|nr:hypothetical protein [Lachnospiraceae bacterium]